MKPEIVEKWSHTIDSFKVIPRALILLYMYLTYTVVFWYIGLESPLRAEWHGVCIDFSPSSSSRIIYG